MKLTHPLSYPLQLRGQDAAVERVIEVSIFHPEGACPPYEASFQIHTKDAREVAAALVAAADDLDAIEVSGHGVLLSRRSR